MAENKVNFIPNNPQTLAFRPLTKGVVRNLPSNGIPEGAFLSCSNFYPTLRGLTKAKSLRQYSSGEVRYPEIQNLFSYYSPTTGLQKALVNDEKFLYEVSGTDLNGIYWEYATGTVDATGTAVTGYSTAWLSANLHSGDVIFIDTGTANEEATIKSINSDTSITLKEALSGTYTGVNYNIQRAFSFDNDRYLDGVITADNSLILVDGARPPLVYNGSTLGLLNSDISYIPSCIAYFRDRVYIGNIQESGSRYRFRVRWTDPGVFDEFPSANYVDLPYQVGDLQRLVPMGNTLIALFDNAIYIGIPSQIPTLPIYFQKIDSPEVGLAGRRAVVEFYDSLIFVGQNNIYQLSSQGVKEIGTPVVEATVKKSTNLAHADISLDVKENLIYFGIPYNGSNIEKIWVYNYITQSWGEVNVNCTMLGVAKVFEGLEIDDLAGTIDDLDISYSSIDNMTYLSKEDAHLYAGISGRLFFFVDDPVDDVYGNAVGEFITGDLDLGAPQHNKTFTKISLKTEDPVEASLGLTVEASTDKGLTWKLLGELTIDSGGTEGKLDFRVTGSLVRFRVRTTTSNNVFTLTEITLRVKLRGQEVRF